MKIKNSWIKIPVIEPQKKVFLAQNNVWVVSKFNLSNLASAPT